MIVREICEGDRADWLRMRDALWPDPSGGHRAEVEAYFAGQLREPLEVLIAVDDADGADAGRALGFAELNIRDHAEGCDTDRVAYLEGWYVTPDARRRGVGRALLRAAEDWARAQGCVEFASDVELGNDASAAAHGRLGFTETARIRCFRKDL